MTGPSPEDTAPESSASESCASESTETHSPDAENTVAAHTDAKSATEGNTSAPDATSKAASQNSKGAVTRRAGLVAAGTLSSRILGALRDIAVQATFGVAITDAFWLAFTIPNSLRVLLAEGAVSGAFVPVLTDVREKHGEAAAKQFYARLGGAMLLLLSGVVALGVAFPELFMHVFADADDRSADTFELTVELTRWVFPYIGLIGLAALASGALYAAKRFAAPAFAPALLNVAFIAAALLLVPVVQSVGWAPVFALAIGALLGGLLQLLAQLPSLRSIGMLRWPQLSFRDPHVRQAFLRLLPMLAGLGVYQLNIILSRRFAYSLPSGAITYLFLSQRLVEIPQGVFALAIGSAALPSIAEHSSRGELAKAKELFRFGLRLNLFVAIPSSVALVILGPATVAVFFGRGAFSADNIAQTAGALSAMAFGIWAVASVRTIVPMFHALGDTRSPVFASATNLVVFIGTALALMPSLAHIGLGYAITAAAIAQLGVLLVLLRWSTGPLGLGKLAGSTAKVMLASLAMGAALYPLQDLAPWSEGATLQSSAALVGLIVLGITVYFAVAWTLRVEELRTVTGKIMRRFHR